MDLECIKKEYLIKFKSEGSDKFYKSLLVCAVKELLKDTEEEKVNISLEFMNLHDKFMILFRREGDQQYLSIAKIFRKAAHKIYRFMLKRGWSEKNQKFLNVV